jgi:hypothetical protein
MIGIRVLGPLVADVDGAPADLGGPRQRCVLARLIAERGRVVSANRLIEDLYADKAPPKALAAAGDTAAASRVGGSGDPANHIRRRSSRIAAGLSAPPASAVVDRPCSSLIKVDVH